MPRAPRLDAPGVIHHVTLRGIGRRLLFADDLDREFFVARLDRLVRELDFVCLAWALMPNHVHLVLRTGRVRISRLLARLATAFAMRVGRRHGWVGHVFQNRFASSRIVGDAYLAAAIAYVHRNPVEAGLVALADLAGYPWTSYGALVGARQPRPFESHRLALGAFGWDVGALAAAVARGAAVPLPEQWRRAPRRKVAPPAVRTAPSVSRLLDEAAHACGLEAADLRRRGRARPVARARRRFAIGATRQLGLSQAEVARVLGVSEPAVAKMLQPHEPRALSGAAPESSVS